MAESSGFMTDLPQSAYLSQSIRRAISAAQQRSHRYVTLEHLLLSLLDDPDALALLEAVRADISAIRSSVSDTVNRNLATLYTPGQFDLRASYKVERVLQTASDDANRLNCSEVDAAFVLSALSRESDNPAADILKRSGFTYPAAMTWLYGNRGKSYAPPKPAQARPQRAPEPQPAAPRAEPQRTPEPAAPAAPRAEPQRAPEPQRAERAAPQIEEPDDLELEVIEDEAPEAPPKPVIPASRGRGPVERVLPQQQAPQPGQAVDYDELEAEELRATQQRAAAEAAELRAAQQRAAVEAAELRAAQQRAAAEAAVPPPAPAPQPQATPAPAPRRREAMAGVREAPVAAPAPRRVEPQMPAPGRLDEMRVGAAARARAQAPAQAPAPPTPATPAPAPVAAGKAARQRPGNAPAKSPNAAASAERPKGRTRRAPRPNETLIGRLIENIPRRMRALKVERIEVRISREETQALARGMEGSGQPVRHEIMITQAMSVILRAPDSGFMIEPLSPETQWIFARPDSSADAEVYGRWRWAVTPMQSGEHRLQLIVAARSIDQNGLAGDVALPDQVITVRVRTNYWKLMARAVQWLMVMALGGIVTELAVIGMRTFAQQ